MTRFQPPTQEDLPVPQLEMVYVHQDASVSPSLDAYVRAAHRLGARWLNLVLTSSTATADWADTARCVEACSLPGIEKTMMCPARAVAAGGLDLERLGEAGWELAITCDLDSVNESLPDISGFRGLKTACLTVKPEQVARLPAAVPELMTCFDRVKFGLAWKDRGDVAAYDPFARALQDLDSRYPGRVLALIPWIFLSQEHLGVGRHVCRYQHTLGLTTSGKVTLCGLPSVVLGDAATSSLAAVWSGHPLLGELRRVEAESFDKPCRICLFRAYCANQCPAQVYARTGSFASSLPECAVLYEDGRFPASYLIDHG